METSVHNIQINANTKYVNILTEEALAFVEALHLKFNERRLELLNKRNEQQKK